MSTGHETAPKEVERKFLVDYIPPNYYTFPHSYIHQGYLAIEASGTEVRLRDKDNVYTQTVKSKGGLEREEFETYLTLEQFEVFWGATEGRRIEKTRFRLPHGLVTVEFDVYHGALLGLHVAEVEFPDKPTADKLILPYWFGREVTEDKRYKNQQLAVHGIPKD